MSGTGLRVASRTVCAVTNLGGGPRVGHVRSGGLCQPARVMGSPPAGVGQARQEPPAAATMRAACSRLWIPSAVYAPRTWYLTVLTVMNNRSAICSFE